MTICSVFIVLNILLKLQANKCIFINVIKLSLSSKSFLTFLSSSLLLHKSFDYRIRMFSSTFKFTLMFSEIYLSCIEKSCPFSGNSQFLPRKVFSFSVNFFLFLSYLAVVLSDKGAYLPGILSMATLKYEVRISKISFLHIKRKTQKWFTFKI